MGVKKRDAKKLIGRIIYAIKKDGTCITGKLTRISGSRLYIRSIGTGRKHVKTSALIPLVLYDLLAIGTSPYIYGGYHGYGYPYGYGAYPYGYFW